jgi:hypothetical protein
MNKILVYLIKNNKKYAVLFNDNDSLLNLDDLLNIEEVQYIDDGRISTPEKIGERWEIKSAEVKKIDKNRNTLKMTVEIDCKLLLRKTPLT